MQQHIENRHENLGLRAPRALGIVLALLAAGCGNNNSVVTGARDASADVADSDEADTNIAGGAIDTVVATITFSVSTPPATAYIGQSTSLSITATASASVFDSYCVPIDAGGDLVVDQANTTCKAVVEANAPCVYAFIFTGKVDDLNAGYSEGVVTSGVICAANSLGVYQLLEYEVTTLSNSLPIGDSGVTYCTNLTDGMIGTGSPGIQITSVSPMGQKGSVSGQVSGIVPICHQVAVYIFVDGGWWIKPYLRWPLTTINADGTWSAYIATGGNDEDASQVIAYLVPSNYDIPLLSGVQSLPPALAAFPSATVNR